jgi:hypothetical protein
LTLGITVTLKEAYLIMFDYLDEYWEDTGKTYEIGCFLGELYLWGSGNNKEQWMLPFSLNGLNVQKKF